MIDRIRDFLHDVRRVAGGSARRLPLALALMLLSAGLDLLGVALVAPFLAATIAPSTGAAGLRGLDFGVGFEVLGLVLVGVFALKGFLAFRVQRVITAISDGVRADLMTRLMAAYQARPYEFHLQRNSSELVNVVIWHAQAFTGGVLAAMLQLVANGLVFLSLAAWLAWTSPMAFLALAGVLALTFAVVTGFVRPRLQRAIAGTGALSGEIIHSVTQAIGAWREIRILGREAYFRARTRAAAEEMAGLTATQASLQQLPRHALELAMVSFLVVLASLARSDGTGALLVPLLGTFAAAAMRLLPTSTALLASWNTLRGNRFVVSVLVRELAVDAPCPDPRVEIPSTMDSFRTLELDEVVFRYQDAPWPALDRVSLRIRQGEVLGIMGRSGAGKSTLADTLLGLLRPQQGRVLVNGRDLALDLAGWHRMVAYIPQSVYLLDDTLRRNIALGLPDREVDAAKVAEVLAQAELQELVATLPEGLDTVVGERGVRLSGGQRQRVAIARALYHDRQFLVLDEATSALDPETEQSVVDAIGSLAGSRTMVVIAHRESTLASCTRIIGMEAGRVVDPRIGMK